MRAHAVVALLVTAMSIASTAGGATAPRVDLAPAAHASASYVSGHESLPALNDGFAPRDSADHTHGCYGNWPERGTQWVQYEWAQPVGLSGTGVYWWDDSQGVRLPAAARVLYWDGHDFVKLADVGVAPNQCDVVDFPAVTTTKLRLEIDAAGTFSSGIIEWQAYDSGTSPPFPPTAHAGPDRTVVLPAATVLHGTGRAIRRAGENPVQSWSKAAGPGEVTFADAADPNTSATFSAPGDYQLRFTYAYRGLPASDALVAHVRAPLSLKPLEAVYVSHYAMSSPFWKDRLKNLIVNWIPHCIAEDEDPNQKTGGLNNLIEAGKKLRGEPYKPHVGYPFANAWVLNTTEAMCVALTYDAQGDAEILKAQAFLRQKLEMRIPIILAAQEPDGYFQTRFTLGTAADAAAHFHPRHWDWRTRGEHEGYVGGYFIEMGIADYIATQGKDRRLYDAARKLADCWCEHLGPAPKRAWFDGHQEMEQALVRLGRFVNDTEGAGGGQSHPGQKYIDLAKFLLDCRGTGVGGQSYDQTQAPVTQQFQAVGHAVRAAYTYSAMADISMETRDPAYWGATLSIWDNLVNRKLYLTGGIGSGETSEGFGPDYSLPNGSAYCESCSSCGLLFMQYKLNLATRAAKYADVYESTVYNALLGDVDLAGKNFTYTNALDSDEARYGWHVCPCCVGNIPRALLMLPTWMYARADDGVYVNLFAGSTVDVGKVAGTELQLVQATDYPWTEQVAITVNPAATTRFAVHVRSPKREVSTLYTATPDGDGLTGLTVNGKPADAVANAAGYVTIDRTWTAGDTIGFALPLPVQEVRASDRVASTRGRVAIVRGPLVYNVESVDQDVTQRLGPKPGLTSQWSPDLLGGVMTVHGTFADGTPLAAIPNYARLNRGGRSLVWLRE